MDKEVLEFIKDELKDIKTEMRYIRKKVDILSIKVYGITPIVAIAASLVVIYLKGLFK